MNDFDPFNERQSRTSNVGFRIGFVGGVMMFFVHLILLFLMAGTNRGDWLASLIGWFVYFFIGRSAAQEQYRLQQSTLEPLRGVREAGIGAALVTCVIAWGIIIVRGVIRDALGITILVEPVSLFCLMIIDGLLALGLGAKGGQTVVNKYRTFTDY